MQKFIHKIMQKNCQISILQTASLGFFSLLLAPNMAFAAGGAGIEALFWPSLNFALYCAILIYLYKRYGQAMLRARSAGIEEQIKHAANVLEQAERELLNVSNRFAGIERECSQVIADFAQEGEKMAELVLKKAQQSAEALENDAQKRAENEYRLAVRAVRDQVIQAASQRARSRLKAEVSVEEDARVRDNMLKGLFQ